MPKTMPNFSYTSLPISGFAGRPLPNLFLKQQEPADHLALLFPGLNYSADMPVLYYPSQILLGHHADVLQVRYEYDRQPDFMRQAAEKRFEQIRIDGFGALETALKERAYQRITLIGKSIGTLSMGCLVGDARLVHSRCIWLTPLLNDDRLISQIGSGGQPGLFVSGTEDRYYDRMRLEHLAQLPGCRSLVVPGADHSLELPAGLWSNLDTLTRVLKAVEEFIG